MQSRGHQEAVDNTNSVISRIIEDGTNTSPKRKITKPKNDNSIDWDSCPPKEVMIPTFTGGLVGAGFGAFLLNNEPAAIMMGFAIGWSAGAFSHLCRPPMIAKESLNKKNEEPDIEMALHKQKNWSDRLSKNANNKFR